MGRTEINTEHVFPPIPMRQFDWMAYVDPEFGPFAYGRTEQKAIDNLKEVIEENSPR